MPRARKRLGPGERRQMAVLLALRSGKHAERAPKTCTEAMERVRLEASFNFGRVKELTTHMIYTAQRECSSDGGGSDGKSSGHNT